MQKVFEKLDPNSEGMSQFGNEVKYYNSIDHNTTSNFIRVCPILHFGTCSLHILEMPEKDLVRVQQLLLEQQWFLVI